MHCQDCGGQFQVLASRLYDYTNNALGCPVKGHWPKYTARVYVDNVELRKCGCGVCVNVPLERLHYHLFGNDPASSIASGDIALDPYSGLIYVGTWNPETQDWILSQHREQ